MNTRINAALLFSTFLSGCVALPTATTRQSHPDGATQANHFVHATADRDRFHIVLAGLGRNRPEVKLLSGSYRHSRGSGGELRFANPSFAPNVGTYDFDLLVPSARPEHDREPELLPHKGSYTLDATYAFNGAAYRIREVISHGHSVQVVPLIPQLIPNYGFSRAMQ